MKKHIILVLALVLSSGPLFAQSSHMTDDQVMSFVVKEHERGTSNSQIVTKLMQKGRLQPIAIIASRASRTTATIHLMMRIILTMLTSARR